MVGFTERLALMKESTEHKEKLLSGELGFTERMALMKRRTEIKEILAGGAANSDPVEPVESTGGLSAAEFSDLSSAEQRATIGEYLSKDNWYEYEQVLFPYLKVVEKGSNYVVFKNKYGKYQFGYKGHISRGYDYWKNDAGSAKKNGGFGSWSRADRSKAIKAITKHEESEQPTQEEQSEIIKLFLAGEFKNSESSKFIDVMRIVHSEGLDLEQIKTQAIAWIDANPDKVAA